ncbi:hypothetical protein GCM10011504_56210 [Siccirubricoccus deserti]|nr:hypothetical protein GCM10011504_56210 [Siccirubricoccus deserti]
MGSNRAAPPLGGSGLGRDAPSVARGKWPLSRMPRRKADRLLSAKADSLTHFDALEAQALA